MERENDHNAHEAEVGSGLMSEMVAMATISLTGGRRLGSS